MQSVVFRLVSLARAHPGEIAAIHLATPGLAAPPKPWADPVSKHLDEVRAWLAEEGGYSHMHATKPATIGAALDDSPVALATARTGTTTEATAIIDRAFVDHYGQIP